MRKPAFYGERDLKPSAILGVGIRPIPLFMRTASDIQNPVEIDRIIEMAWEDRTPFGAIEFQFGLREGEVIKLMRRELKPSSWRLWRARVQGRTTKHRARRRELVDRFRCSRQRTISRNKVPKR